MSYIQTILNGVKAYIDKVNNNKNFVYETKTDASAKLEEAKLYADDVGTNVKNDLLNGVGEAYDTLKELGDLIDENVDAIQALETIANGKQNKITGINGQVVGFNADGNAVAQDNPQPDWNQNNENALNYIKNKPIVFIGGDTLTWDGNADGLASAIMPDDIPYNLYCVSSVIPTKNDFANGITMGVIQNGVFSSMSAPGSTAQANFREDGFTFGEGICIVPYDNYIYDTMTFPKSGTYFMYASMEGQIMYVSSLTINDYTGFPQAKFDENYIPDTIARQSIVDEQLATKAPAYTYSQTDLEAGVSELETGKLYFVYE